MKGEELKEARLARHLTQKKLGLLLGYPENTAERIVQHWEYGTHPIPLKHFRKLSEILEIPIDKFIP